MIENNKYIGRLAPSPSSYMHMGNIFTFLITWADARKNCGKLILRFDDLDERCKQKKYKDQILDDFSYLGIDYDEIIYQSKRVDRYEQYYKELIDLDLIYPCYCSRADLRVASAPHLDDGTPIYLSKCRIYKHKAIEQSKSPAFRIEVPNAIVTFDDKIAGKYSQNLLKECGDFVVKRSDGVFGYQLTSVIDDIEKEITHVIRGNDLINSTPRQIWLESILRNKPIQNIVESKTFTHIPILINSDGNRLAKRKSDLSILEMRKDGVSKEQIIGEIAYMLSLIDKTEPIDENEFLKIYSTFDLSNLNNKSQILWEPKY